MASNKKAQILAAVMCASSIFGSYTVVSAADTPTKIESTDKNSSVTANGSTITVKAGATGGQQSTITLGDKSLAINVGKQTTTDGITYGAFSLNSSNVVVNGNRLTMKSSTSSYATDLTNAGLTIKDGKTTVASLNNNGLNIYDGINTKATATITKAGAITGTGLTVKAVSDTIKTEGNYVESKVTTSGVADTIKQGGFTRATSNVTTNSIKDTIYTDSGTELSSINVFKNTAANGIENGKVSLTAKKIVTDNQTSTTTTSTLTLGGDNASLKVGNYGFTVDSNNNVLFSGKNASLTSTGLTVNGTGTSSIKSTNATTEAYTKNDISSAGMTTTARGGKYPSDNDNKTTSAVTYTGVTDTVYDDGGNLKTKSSVTTSGITNTVYDVNTGNALANSSLTTSGISNTTTDLAMTGANAGNTMSTTLNQNSAGITASATKKAEDGSTIGTSTLTLGGNSASLKVGNYGFAVDNNNNVSINGKNASLSGSTFTLKDIASGKNVASLSTRGLSIYNADGTSVGGISNTGAVSGKSLSITAENADGNKTISTVSATGVTDTVYGTDETTKVAYSSVGTGGISNTTSLKTDTGKIDTAINQNKSGVSISSTAYSGQNLRSGNSSVSVNGAKTTISSSGGYEYSSDGEVLKYNTASLSLDGNAGTVGLSGKNVSLTNTDLTLKNVETGKAYVKIGSNGLNIYNDEGTSVFGVTRTGAINIDKNVTIDDSYTKDGYTYTASNSISGSNGIRNVATKKDESGKTIATSSSTVTTSGITNSTNISGIAIKDDKNNTKTMNTSIAQNANGVSISSTKYNVYSDGTNTIQTTDGTSSISVNGAKTTISGYGNYEYERDESGKLVVSSRNSASLSVDGESGIISLSGKNVGLNANGLTLYKDVEGVKTQYASLSAGGLSVNGTSTTTIKSTNATTGAMGQSQVSYNGVTDTVTNAAGNKTTSTVSATGTTDQVYDTDGKTRIAYSNVTTNGITDSFTKDGVTNSVTTNANGTTFASTGNGTTTIKGGSITTNSITVAGNTIDGGFFDTIGETNSNTAGIVRTEINGDWITSIEGAINISRSGNISLNADKLTYSYNDGKNSGTLGALANKVDDIYDRTQGIDYDKATGTTTIDGNLSVKDETTTGGTAGSTGETGTTPINGNITANTANIGGVQMGNNTVTATTGNFENITVGGTEGTSINKDGVTVGDKKSDNYTSITNNDVVVNNNGNKTSLADVGNRVTGLESSVNSMNNRLSDVEDRIDKVGAMSAAIANLRTMGFDPEAPTEIAIGVGQYKSETGLALGVFHYPNQDFMLSASISTSGDEVMGGIGATWKLGRKSAAEKAKDEEARRLEKAEEMKKLAQDAKVKAQAERHAKLLAEREAQKTA